MIIFLLLLQIAFAAGIETTPQPNPMTTGGDTIYGGTNGVQTRLPNGTANQHYLSAGTTSPPVWTTVPFTVGANISSTGTVSNENVDFINGNCSSCTSGSCTCSFNSSFWTASPICGFTVSGDVTAAAVGNISISAASTSAITYKMSTSGVGNINRDVYITCNGLR